MKSSNVVVSVILCCTRTLVLIAVFGRNVKALPQPMTCSFSPSTKPANFERFSSKTVLHTSKLAGVSPLALCAGAASFISGFDVGIIAGALLLLVPAFRLDPHRCEDWPPLQFSQWSAFVLAEGLAIVGRVCWQLHPQSELSGER